MGLFQPQASLPHFILGNINKAFPLYSTVTKYGEEMTNALFPFIKLGPTTVFPAYTHTPIQTHLNCDPCVHLEPPSLIAL